MTEKEFSLIALALKTYFPRDNFLPNEQAVRLWFNQLQDVNYKFCEMAVNKWVAQNKFPPTICELREEVANIAYGNVPTWDEAYHQVQRAISKWGYYNPEEGKAYLDDLTREVVNRIGWTKICLSESPDVIRANFRDIYNTLSQRAVKDRMIPNNLKTLISETQSKIGLLEQKKEA